MTGAQYWQKRQEQKYLAGEKQIDDYYRGLKKSFEQAKKEIQDVINSFYWRYAEENGLTFTAAQQQLSKAEIGELDDFIAKVNENMGKYDQELNNMSIKARITRYEGLQKQIDAALQQLYSIDYEASGAGKLKDVYSDSYYQTWFNIDQYHGFHQNFSQVDAKAIDELISYPFDGADFSTRLWKQKDHLLQQLNESVTTMLIQGRNPRTLAADFAKKFERKEYEAYRLLHTEGSFVMEQASQAAYVEDGVEKYQWLATLDVKTCDDCQPLDGEVFEVGKGVTGTTMPPKHSFCRCTTVPYHDDQELDGDTRVARDPVTSKGYEVPADMRYEQWHKQYIEGNPEAVLAEKKIRNYGADKKQYERYKKVLGSEAGNSLDKFQNLKYNNSEKWKALQMSYKEQNIRNNIRSDKQLKTIEVGQQNKHIAGTNEYKQYVEKLARKQQYGPSRINVSIEQAQELVNEYHGTGEIKIKNGKWTNDEVIINNDISIGTVVNNLTGAEVSTTVFKIKYGKKGTHIIPDYPSKKEGKK